MRCESVTWRVDLYVDNLGEKYSCIGQNALFQETSKKYAIPTTAVRKNKDRRFIIRSAKVISLITFIGIQLIFPLLRA